MHGNLRHHLRLKYLPALGFGLFWVVAAVLLWRVASSEAFLEKKCFDEVGHSGPVYTAVFSPDGGDLSSLIHHRQTNVGSSLTD